MKNKKNIRIQNIYNSITILFLSFFLISSCTPPIHNNHFYRLMTYNIRYDNPDDGDCAWQNRKKALCQQIIKNAPDILCIQEGLKHQVDYIRDALNNYSLVGVGRDNGIDKGEYCAIYYDSTKFQCLKEETIWLSETPYFAGSKGWDAACPRIVTWARLKTLHGNKQIFIFNTHLDHIGREARKNSLAMIKKLILKEAESQAFILCGDFNMTSEDSTFNQILNDTVLNIDNSAAKALETEGPYYTYAGFDPSENKGVGIDYIFTSNKIKIFKHQTLKESHKGCNLSDHLPLLIDFKW